MFLLKSQVTTCFDNISVPGGASKSKWTLCVVGRRLVYQQYLCALYKIDYLDIISWTDLSTWRQFNSSFPQKNIVDYTASDIVWWNVLFLPNILSSDTRLLDHPCEVFMFDYPQNCPPRNALWRAILRRTILSTSSSELPALFILLLFDKIQRHKVLSFSLSLIKVDPRFMLSTYFWWCVAIWIEISIKLW